MTALPNAAFLDAVVARVLSEFPQAAPSRIFALAVRANADLARQSPTTVRYDDDTAEALAQMVSLRLQSEPAPDGPA